MAGQSLESCAALQREGEDLEIPGAFLEGGAEEDKKGEAGEGRDESAGWLGGNLGVRRGGGESPRSMARALLFIHVPDETFHTEMIYVFELPQMAAIRHCGCFEHPKCSESEWRCVLGVKCTPRFKDFVWGGETMSKISTIF